MSASARVSTWQFTIWGSRGSVPVSAQTTGVYGGETTCLELDLPGARILVDAGSGLADLARTKAADGKPTLLLFSHLHWDHVLGLPFYSAIYESGWTLDIRGVPRTGKSVLDAVLELNRPPLFPIALRTSIRAQVEHTPLAEHGSSDVHGVRVRWMEVHHPGGCSAFSFEVGGQRIVFTGDLEILKSDRAALARFCAGADVLLADGQYTEAEYPARDGWGHSTNMQCAHLAADAGVGRLVITHHDPAHGDAKVTAMIEEARSVFAATEGARSRMVVASG